MKINRLTLTAHYGNEFDERPVCLTTRVSEFHSSKSDAENVSLALKDLLSAVTAEAELMDKIKQNRENHFVQEGDR